MNRESTRRRVTARTVGLFLVAATVAAAGCGEDEPLGPPEPPTGPITRDEIIGTYDALEMTFVAGSDTTDVLAIGGSLTLTLANSAQSSGRLLAPGQGAAGADVDEDMDGAWTYEIITRTVRLTQQANSFVGDASFQPDRTEDGFGIELSASVPGDAFLGTPSVDVTLRRR